MKINKKILLASMLTANLVAAQEYYTCVPKKTCPSLEEIKQVLKTVKPVPPIPTNGTWKEKILLTPNSIQSEFQQKLQPGKYKVTAAGAGAAPVIREFILNEEAEFKACTGLRGEYGGYLQPNQDESISDGMGGGAGGCGGSGIGYNGTYTGTSNECIHSFENNGRLRKAGKASKGPVKGGNGGCCNKDSKGYDGEDGSGYGKGYPGKGGKGSLGGGKITETYDIIGRYDPEFGKAGYGCYAGGGGGGGAGGASFTEKGKKSKGTYVIAIKAQSGEYGGNGGSYFGIDGIVELILKGGNMYHNNENHDGYVKIEKWE